MARVIGWVINPLSHANTTHQPIGLTDDEQLIVYNDSHFLPSAFLAVMSFTQADILWTAKERTLHDASWYDSFSVNAIIQGEDQEALRQQWRSFLKGEAIAPSIEG